MRAWQRRLLETVAEIRPVDGSRVWLRKRLGPAKTKAARKAAAPETPLFRIEALEPRLLLSSDLTLGAEQAFLGGLQDLTSVFSDAKALAAFQTPLPVINRTIGDVADLSSSVDAVRVATQSFFTANPTGTLTGLADQLRATPNLVASASASQDGTVERLSLSLKSTGNAAYIFDLSQAVTALELRTDGSSTIALQTERSLVIDVGIDTATNTFFVTPGSFKETVSAPTAAVSGKLDVGIVDTTIKTGQASLTATLTGSFKDPDNTDGRNILTAADLRATPRSALLGATATGSASVTLSLGSDVAGLNATSGGTTEPFGLSWSGDLRPGFAKVDTAAGSRLPLALGITRADFARVADAYLDLVPNLLDDQVSTKAMVLVYDPGPAASLQALAAGESTVDTFTYQVTDGFGAKRTGTVSVTVAGRNDAPVAADDRGRTAENKPVLVAVLANDRDPDKGSALTVSGVQAVSDHGAAVTIGTGGVLYDPSASAELRALAFGSLAVDRFTYTVSDGQGGSATATVLVEVSGNATTAQDKVLTATTAQTAVLSVDTGIAIQSITRGSAKGALVAFDGTTLTYDGRAALALRALPEGGVTDDTVGFTGLLGGRTVQGTLKVTVTGVNEAPTVYSFVTDAKAGTPLSVDIRARASDRDAGTVLGVLLPAATSKYGASLTVKDGSVVYDTSTAQALTDLAAGLVLADRFDIQVVDDKGLTASASVIVNVTGTRLAGAPAVFGPMSVGEDTVAKLQLPAGSGYTIVASGVTSTLGAKLSLAGGILRYDPAGRAAIQSLAEGETAADAALVVVRDGLGNTRLGRIDLTVLGAYDAPVVRPDTVAASDRAPTTINVLANDTVTDHDGALTLVGVDATTPLGATVTIADGKLVYDASGLAAVRALVPGQSLSDGFTYTVTDKTGVARTATVTLSIAGHNDAPAGAPDAAATNEATPIAIAVLGNDTDVDSPVLAIGTITPVSALGATVVVNADGTLGYDPRGSAKLAALAPGQTATDTLYYNVQDAYGAAAWTKVTVTVTGLNSAPTAKDDRIVVTGASPVTANVLANDRDPDAGAVLTVSADAKSALGGSVTVNAQNRIVYDPAVALSGLAAGQVREDTVAYTVTDQFGASATAVLRVTLVGQGAPPKAVADAATTTKSAKIVLNVLGNDLGSGLTVSALPATSAKGATLTLTADNRVVYDPAGSAALQALTAGGKIVDSFVYVLSNSLGATATGQVTVTVTAAAEAPREAAAEPASETTAARPADLEPIALPASGTARAPMPAGPIVVTAIPPAAAPLAAKVRAGLMTGPSVSAEMLAAALVAGGTGIFRPTPRRRPVPDEAWLSPFLAGTEPEDEGDLPVFLPLGLDDPFLIEDESWIAPHRVV